ncbi:hypothetical protein Adt_33558 [Abeliophyllum distichum]|uniref:Uncharacterized protein n=1 Tax=Abeliophyllum distichum TaxID=126358 RepID=A0ABD1QXV6_9LAMI
MSSSAIGGDALGHVGGEASLSVLPSMEGVLPIRGVDKSTGEAIPIDAAPSLSKADDPFRVDIVRAQRTSVFSEEEMQSTAFKCVREWDALASLSDAPKDSECL